MAKAEVNNKEVLQTTVDRAEVAHSGAGLPQLPVRCRLPPTRTQSRVLSVRRTPHEWMRRLGYMYGMHSYGVRRQTLESNEVLLILAH
jgi:hypothetical protein